MKKTYSEVEEILPPMEKFFHRHQRFRFEFDCVGLKTRTGTLVQRSKI